MLRHHGAFLSVALLTIPWVVVNAAVYTHKPSRPKLPGHSDSYEVTGSSGFGCQARDSEVIPYRNPDRMDEDDGTLWTGETIVKTKRYPVGDDGGPDFVCNGTFYLPTVFWIGPYLQGENGTDNKFGIGMIAWETNDTNKADAWHVYRPCGEIWDDSPPSWDPYTIALDFMGAVHYSNATPPDDSTFGLRLIPPPPGNGSQTSSSPQIFFNGTYNGIDKETDEYLGDFADTFGSFSYDSDLNCTGNRDYLDLLWGDIPEGSYLLSGPMGEIPPGSTVNGSLTNNTIVLRISGTIDSEAVAGVESPTPRVTNSATVRTEIDITFNGRYDARNSSQSLIINPTNETAVTFLSVGILWRPSLSLLSGILLLLSLCFLL